MMVSDNVFLHFEIEGREYRVDRFMLPEARAVQRVTGKTLAEAMRGADSGDMECLAAILWVVFKRDHPKLTWEQMDEPGGPGDIDLLTFKRLDVDDAKAEAEPATSEATSGGPEGNGQAGSRRATKPRTPAGR